MTAKYFVNFTPADAVQYDGTQPSGSEALEWLRSDRGRIYNFYRYARDARLEAFVIEENGDVYLCPGQWLVRQGSRVWVQDEEPARVVKWEFRVVGSRSGGKWLEHSLEGALLTQRMYGGLIERRPVLSNGWTGPWLPVDGGAE